MRVCLFEDARVDQFEPLSLTRPVFDLLCGTRTLGQKQIAYFDGKEIGALVRSFLAEACKLSHFDWFVNDWNWLAQEKTILVNGRWLPPSQCHANLEQPHLGILDEEIVYAVLDAQELRCSASMSLAECLETWYRHFPKFPAGGQLLRYPWDLVELNGSQIIQDFSLYPHSPLDKLPSHLFAVIGPRENLHLAPSAHIEPMVVIDTSTGPVIIDENAKLSAFSRLEGPCYIGPGSQVHGAKIRSGTTLGSECRVGGEVEASILLGYSNKYHEGFLGHSYLGEWINLGAGTHNSDLRNDYGEVSVVIHNSRISTGLKKVGCFIGDHTKTGLGTLINTGSNLGAFCNVLPAGMFAPKYLPSFTSWWRGSLRENFELNLLLSTAAKVMERRGGVLAEGQKELYRRVYEETGFVRRRVLHERETKAVSRSA